jgi:hypothetical protein
MRELYCGCVCVQILYSEEETVRERRGSYNGCAEGCIPSFCWIIIRKVWEIYLVDVSHSG